MRITASLHAGAHVSDKEPDWHLAVSEMKHTFLQANLTRGQPHYRDHSH